MTHAEFRETWAQCCQGDSNCRHFRIGQAVTWDGGADVYRPRPYVGTIIAAGEVRGTANVEDNEWHAISAVACLKLRHLKAQD
jgi:hypothetical protein